MLLPNAFVAAADHWIADVSECWVEDTRITIRLEAQNPWLEFRSHTKQSDLANGDRARDRVHLQRQPSTARNHHPCTSSSQLKTFVLFWSLGSGWFENSISLLGTRSVGLGASSQKASHKLMTS
eukprot:2211639-Amphidinium_carterae.1